MFRWIHFFLITYSSFQSNYEGGSENGSYPGDWKAGTEQGGLKFKH